MILNEYLLQVIAPWRLPEFFERFQGRSDLIEYAKKENIPVSATPKEPWSTDENIMHIRWLNEIIYDPTQKDAIRKNTYGATTVLLVKHRQIERSRQLSICISYCVPATSLVSSKIRLRCHLVGYTRWLVTWAKPKFTAAPLTSISKKVRISTCSVLVRTTS